MKKIVLFILLINALFAHTMDAKEILVKMQKVYKTNKTYEFKMIYSLYKGHKSNHVEESYEGFTYRDKNGLYQKIAHNEFIYGNDFFLRLDNTSKKIDLFSQQQNTEFIVNIDNALSQCYSIDSEKKDGYYSIVLKIKNSNNIPLSLLKIKIDEKTFELKQLDLYYSTIENFSNRSDESDIDQPHLRIDFKDFNNNPKSNQELIKLNRYLIKKEGKYIPTDLFKIYQFKNNQK